MRVAELMPDVKFKGIFSKRQLPPDLHVPNNVDLLTDVDYHTFYETFANAAICMMPLNAISPCGLSVVQKAMLMGLNIVGTDTPSMRVLIPNKEHGLLTPMGDAEAMAKAVRYVIDNTDVAATMRANNAMLMDELFSPRAVSNQLINVIEKIAND